MVWRALALALAPVAVPAAGDLQLSLPIDCPPDMGCYIQQYVDHDPGPEAEDYTCGTLSYDGHTGTDFALPTLADLEAEIPVRASAPGTVRGVRDGMADRLFTPEMAEALEGRGCGNGVAIRHDDGWETQYCHLARGSVTVAAGDRVERGDQLGLVGLSGRTEFPHVELIVRRNGETVDPFDPQGDPACGAAPDDGLWLAAPAYRPGGLLSAGFAPAIPEYAAIKAGEAARDSLPLDAPALVVFALAFGARTGDVIALGIEGPQGEVIDHSALIERDRAQLFRAAGTRRPPDGWPAGDYRGTVTLTRDGTELERIETTITLR
ncbi:M23 family peptidase [Rhodosalinus halophilus]|uniref:M23 family peptidase n=1 Tax=Rhodosalinus halophilus TaxID=2259333 RepID=A0A365UA13_9RHOB|nr:M23 family peptidase [Rhodosalinus halophilus]